MINLIMQQEMSLDSMCEGVIANSTSVRDPSTPSIDARAGLVDMDLTEGWLHLDR